MKKIAVIGAGNMGGAIIRRLKGFKIVVTDKDKAKTAKLKRELKITTVINNKEAVKGADIIILAVKPQDMTGVLYEVSGLINSEQLIISIAAGITTKIIEKNIKNKISVIRVVPNTPALVGEGISVICRGRYAGKEDLRVANRVFSCVGKVLVVKNEKLMNAVTAVSGSGPAYVYLFKEVLIKAAKKLGLSEAQSKELVFQTVKGSLELLLYTGKTLKELRKQVTSPGGTTETAIEILKKGQFEKIICEAVKSAALHAGKLNKELE